VSGVNRWNIRIERVHGENLVSMQYQNHGPWVAYEDYASASALIQEMREALESAKEELYQISHSGGNPDDEANMDSYAAAYRECKHALSKAHLT